MTQFCWWKPNSTQGWESQNIILIYSIFATHGILSNLWLLKKNAEIFSEWEIRLLKQVVYHCALVLRQVLQVNVLCEVFVNLIDKSQFI